MRGEYLFTYRWHLLAIGVLEINRFSDVLPLLPYLSIITIRHRTPQAPVRDVMAQSLQLHALPHGGLSLKSKFIFMA